MFEEKLPACIREEEKILDSIALDETVVKAR